jgi:hypothetical protein
MGQGLGQGWVGIELWSLGTAICDQANGLLRDILGFVLVYYMPSWTILLGGFTRSKQISKLRNVRVDVMVAWGGVGGGAAQGLQLLYVARQVVGHDAVETLVGGC